MDEYRNDSLPIQMVVSLGKSSKKKHLIQILNSTGFITFLKVKLPESNFIRLGRSFQNQIQL